MPKLKRITAYSKRWWNEKVAEARKIWAKDKKRLSGDGDLKEELKQARNSYYRTIRKAKRLCWQKNLQGGEQQSHCWTALKYTKPLQFKTTPALQDSDGNIVTSMKAKEALVRKSAFPQPPSNLGPDPITSPGITHATITKDIVSEALVSQSATKAQGPDKINFQFYVRDKIRITSMVQHAIRLGYHPRK